MQGFDKHIAWQLSQHVAQVIEPLEREFGIAYTTYFRYYDDNTAAMLFTDGRAVSNCFQHADYRLPGVILQPGTYSWRELYSEAVLADLRKKYGYDHGITILRRQHDYIEHLTFATDPGHHEIMEMYRQHPEVLTHWLFYFQNSMQTLFDEADKNRLQIPKAHLQKPESALSQDRVADFLDRLKLKRYPLCGNHGQTYLTTKEFNCLLLLLQSKSSKEIAQDMALTQRTAEFHIANIKQKLGVHSRSGFFAIAKNNGLLDLLARM